MRPAKYMVLGLLWLVFFRDAAAQIKSKVPASINAIFDDLPIDDPATNSILRPGEDAASKIKNNLFVTGVISKNHCFLGEPLLLTYTLYSALQSTSKVDKAPSFAGFSVDAMETDNEQVTRKKQNGKNYRVFAVQQVRLTPLQEGLLTIEPMVVYNEVSYKENEKAAHYSGNVETGAIRVSVDSLPAANRPADFSGATGSFTIHVVADTLSAAGENNTLLITVTGTGNFTAVSMPGIVWPADCEHFSANSKLRLIKNSFPPSGEKIFEIPFVAKKQGTLVIPALRLAYFDTQKKTYRFAQAGPVSIRVSPALQPPAPGIVTEPLKKALPFYYWLLALPVLLVLGIVLYRKGKQRAALNEEPAAPIPQAEKTPQGLDDHMQLEALSAFDDAGEYITAFKKLLTDSLRRQTGVLLDSESAVLRQIQLKDAELAAAAGQLSAKCNHLLYSPGILDAVTRKEMEESFVSISVKMKQLFG